MPGTYRPPSFLLRSHADAGGWYTDQNRLSRSPGWDSDGCPQGLSDLSHRGSPGKTIAVPNRFSNQKLLVVKALKDHGVRLDEVKILEMAPPDMPAAIFSKAVDAITSGEPFMGQAESRWLWSRLVPDERCLAELHFLCAGGAGGRHS